MYSYAIHMGFNEQTAMDAIHDVFYKLCINQSVLNNISNHKSYLLRALRNRLIDINRSDRIQTVENTKKEEDAEKLTFMLNVTVEDELIEKEAQDEIRHKVEEYLKN